jgi:hypothetical protein
LTALLETTESGRSKMTAAASRAPLGSEFDNFLFALIGEDRDGMPLSVVSALGRMGLDPWHEAAALAGMPAESAVLQLVTRFRALPDQLFKDPDRGTSAERLIALLPHPANSRAQAHATPAESGSPTRLRSWPSANIVLFAIYVVAYLIYQFVSTRGDLPAQREPTHAPTSLTTPLQTPR